MKASTRKQRRRRRAARYVFIGSCALALLGCRASRPAALPSGAGLVGVDADDEAQRQRYEQPVWKAGQRFVYVRGGLLRIELRVEVDGDGYRLVDEQSGLETRYTSALAARGQSKPDAPELALEFDPADYELTWPLWVGKRWTCHFVSRAAGAPDVPWLVTYACDAAERVTVPAGSYECLRIWCRTRAAIEGSFAERTSIAWYAPELGMFVRRLSEGLATELVEIRRE